MADTCRSCHAPEDASVMRRYYRYLRLSELNDKGCLIWAGPKNRHGYGVLQRTPKSRGNILVHRLAWQLQNGPIAAGLNVLHRCDTPPCINAERDLFLGTQLDNIADMLAKGRGRTPVPHGKAPRGIASPRAKLDDDLVREMRRRYQAGEGVMVLAAAYGIDDGHASRIIHRKRWTHVQ
jgi:HNH endonuclease